MQSKCVCVCVCVFCSKSWGVFRRNADRVIDSIRTVFPDIEAEVNPKKPRSKTFEVGHPLEISDMLAAMSAEVNRRLRWSYLSGLKSIILSVVASVVWWLAALTTDPWAWVWTWLGNLFFLSFWAPGFQFHSRQLFLLPILGCQETVTLWYLRKVNCDDQDGTLPWWWQILAHHLLKGHDRDEQWSHEQLNICS